MGKESNDQPRPFDVRTVHYLIRLMDRHELNEIDLREGDRRIRLVRGATGVAAGAPIATVISPQAGPTPPQAAPTPAPAAVPEKPLVEIKSPTPGTFYACPKPDTPAFVQVGTRVTPSTVVCIVEAMKIFNEITADCTGVVTEILVENQQPVEYDQPLFRVDPSG